MTCAWIDTFAPTFGSDVSSVNETAPGDPAVRIMSHFIGEWRSGESCSSPGAEGATKASQYHILTVCQHCAVSTISTVGEVVLEPQFSAKVRLWVQAILTAERNQGVQGIEEKVAQKVLWDYQTPGVSRDITDIIGLRPVADIEAARIGERMQY